MDELRQGPGLSRVVDIAVQELPVREGADSEDSFEIR
jgi:hypothetical protein